MSKSVSVTQLCPNLCDPMDCSPPGSSVPGGKNTGVDCHSLLQGYFPTQGSKPGLMHCRWILHCLSHPGSPHHILLTFKAHSFLLISTNKWEFWVFLMASREGEFLLHVRHDRHFPSILSARLSQEMSTLVPTSDAHWGCVFVTWKATVKASHVCLRDASVYF